MTHEEIITLLKTKICTCQKDYYNDFTLSWSKGYRKGLQDFLKELEIKTD